MRLINADALYEKVQHDEELARNRVLDTESTLPYPNNLNPSYTRYVAQMDERTRLKHMIADALTIEPERKKGKWIDGYKRQTCSVCRQRGYRSWKFCPNCGADMRGEDDGE